MIEMSIKVRGRATVQNTTTLSQLEFEVGGRSYPLCLCFLIKKLSVNIRRILFFCCLPLMPGLYGCVPRSRSNACLFFHRFPPIVMSSFIHEFLTESQASEATSAPPISENNRAHGWGGPMACSGDHLPLPFSVGILCACKRQKGHQSKCDLLLFLHFHINGCLFFTVFPYRIR